VVDWIRFSNSSSCVQLNKQSMHMGNIGHQDELHWFAEALGYTGYICEINVLPPGEPSCPGGLWTTRVTSHIALHEVPQLVTPDRIKDATRLAYRELRAAGVSEPRIAVSGLNPHNGDGGIFGREEIDVIGPAVEDLTAELGASLAGTIAGPFPSDTIFLKAVAGEVDCVVTMYHDQGQVAMKLLGCERRLGLNHAALLSGGCLLRTQPALTTCGLNRVIQR
jgi:4-hydroxythreonine-4-phosphate dehydrogenase